MEVGLEVEVWVGGDGEGAVGGAQAKEGTKKCPREVWGLRVP